MIKRNMRSVSFSILVLIIVLLTFSCRKFEGDITVPAYLKIDSLDIFTDYQVQGSNSENITTVWVYLDDQIIGINELPAIIPVLAEGSHKVRLDAGINMDGIKALRVYYPFYENITQDMEFTALDTLDLNASSYISKTTYYDNTEFLWMVDFEDPSFNLDSISPSKTNIHRTPKNDPEAFLSSNSHYSGVVYLTNTDSTNFFRIATNVESGDGFVLERLNNIPIFIELNFKCNATFTIGVYANGSTTEIKAVLNFNATSEWKKIYINLKPVVDASIYATNFNIFFQGYHDSANDTTWVYLDNIKLLTR